MKYFMIEVTYTAPIEKIDENLQLHRDFLQTGYDQNLLLMSGPQNPRTGGILIARSNSLADLKAFFSNDPYQKLALAEYRFVEFSPVKHAKLVAPWIE
jgi:uncharacterized protein YciI